MKFTDTIKLNRDFRRLYAKGKSAAAPHLVVYARRNGRKINRIGFTVGTKLGKAVQRNRVRRRLREIYRLNEDKVSRGYDIIIVARVKSRYAEYSELEADMLRLFSCLGITREGQQ